MRATPSPPAAKRWPFRTIGDVAELLPSNSIATAGEAEVLAITSACLAETGFNPTGVKPARMRTHDVKESLVRPGEVLIARSNTPDLVGRVSLYAGEPPGVVASDLTIRLWPKPDITSEFLAFYLSFLYKTGHWRDRAGGASGSMKKITRSQILSQQVPVPSAAEQRSLSASLRDCFARINAAVDATALQLSQTSSLAFSLIRQSLNSAKAANICLGDVLQEVKRRIGSSWANYPVLGATRAGLALAKERPGKYPDRYKPVEPGTVFYNPMRIMIGSIAFVDNDDPPGITSPDYVVLKGKPGLVDSRWFYYWLRSPLGERCIQSLARGAVRERMLFNRLAEGEIQLPDFAAQQRASQALAQIKPMRAALEKQMQELELLPQKLLAQAFGT